MINYELLKPVNLLTISLIIFAWMFIHEKIVKKSVVKDATA